MTKRMGFAVAMTLLLALAVPLAAADFTITAKASPAGGGTISPAGKVLVPPGSDQTFTMAPGVAFQIKDVVVDGKSVGAVSSYTFQNVTGNHNITVKFVTRICNVKLEAASGGTISPSGVKLAKYGSKLKITVKATSSPYSPGLTVDGKSVPLTAKKNGLHIQASGPGGPSRAGNFRGGEHPGEAGGCLRRQHPIGCLARWDGRVQRCPIVDPGPQGRGCSGLPSG